MKILKKGRNSWYLNQEHSLSHLSQLRQPDPTSDCCNQEYRFPLFPVPRQRAFLLGGAECRDSLSCPQLSVAETKSQASGIVKWNTCVEQRVSFTCVWYGENPGAVSPGLGSWLPCFMPERQDKGNWALVPVPLLSSSSCVTQREACHCSLVPELQLRDFYLQGETEHKTDCS